MSIRPSRTSPTAHGLLGTASGGMVAEVEQHRIPRSLLLHLLPGVVTAALFYGLGPWVVRAGYPGIAAGILAGTVGVVLLQSLWLLRERRRLGSWGAVLPYRPGPFTWRKWMLVIGLVVWGFAASMVLAGLRDGIKASTFGWLPAFALNPLPADVQQTAHASALVVTAIGYLLILVLLGPLVEEFFFRGYLMPRLAWLGAFAPLLNVVLFSAYHLWKPWDVVTVIVSVLPLGYAVWWFRDIRIGIAAHMLLNGISFFIGVLPRLLVG